MVVARFGVDGCRVRAGQVDEELVSSESGGDGSCGEGEQAPGEYGQDLVAGRVAQGVVDLFEPVEVEQEQRRGTGC